MDTAKNLILRDLYYSPKTGFRSANHLLDLAKKEDSSFKLSEVKQWLETQHTYSKYKSYNRPHFYRSIFVRHLAEQVQMDLLIYERHTSENRKYKYILVAIEILSRFAFAIPLKKRDSTTMLNAIQLFLQKFKNKFHEMPKAIQFDEGTEFNNKILSHFFKQHDITTYTMISKQKTALAERLILTIRTKFKKLFDYQKNHNWIDHLPDIIHNYNTEEHSSIQMAPSEVNFENQSIVWNRLYGSVARHIGEPKFKIGDQVRVFRFEPKGKEFIQKYRKIHPPRIKKKTGKRVREGTQHELKQKDLPNFSDEIFTISNVLMGDPIVYKLYSPDIEMEVLGKFYESELSLIRK